MVQKQYDHIDFSRLKELRAITNSKKTGMPLQQKEIAEQIGISQAYYSQIENDKHRSPNEAFVKAMAAVFSMAPSDFLNSIERLPKDASPEDRIPKIELSWIGDTAAKPRIPKFTTPYNPKDMHEIFADLETGVLFDNPDWVEAPPYLRNVEGAYCLIMPDDSMEPRYRHGDVLYVNPEVLPTRADDAVIQIKYKDRVIAIVGEVTGMENEADPDDDEELPAYAIISCVKKTSLQFEAHIAERDRVESDEDFEYPNTMFNPFAHVIAHSKWYLFPNEDFYTKPLTNPETGEVLMNDDKTSYTAADLFKIAQGAGANGRLRFLALDIHPIVGTQRYRYGDRKSSRVSISAKSIMTAKAEVGKVEIKTTDG